MPDQWLTAFDARQTVAHRRDASTSSELQNLQFAIVDYARTILPARCRYMWEVLIGDEPGEKLETRDTLIPSWVWDLTDDLKMDWATGIFHLAGDRDGVTMYVKLVGVEFDGAVVDQLWPQGSTMAAGQERILDAPPAKEKARSNAGRKRSAGWNDWVAYLVIAAPDIVREEGPEALINKVAHLMTEDGISEMNRSTVQPAAQAVIRLLEQKKL